MNGLLQFLQTPAGQGLLSAGLGVAANAGRGGTWNAIGRGGLMGLSGYSNAQNQQQANELRDMQIANYKAEVATKNRNETKAATKQAALPGLFRQGGLTGGEAVPQTMGGVEMFSKPLGVAPMQATPGGFDVMGAVRAGFDPDEIQKYVGLQDAGKPKATRQMEVDDGRGGKRIALVDDFGREVAGFNGYIPPVQVNQGDRVSFVRPSAGAVLPVGMSPSERDASARGWANVNISRDQANAGKVPAGYRMLPDGSMQAIPGGPADLKAGAEGLKRTGDANDVLGILNEVETLLPKATNSYLGAGYDILSAGFGSASEGAKAGAQLKALQGALVSKMPKMSGPQSDKDVQLYREMAGQVGDPTIPADTRQAAVDTIRKLNEKYAGVPEGSSKPKPPASVATPTLRWDPKTRTLKPV